MLNAVKKFFCGLVLMSVGLSAQAGHLFSQAELNTPIVLSSGFGIDIPQLALEGTQTNSAIYVCDFGPGDSLRVTLPGNTQTFNFGSLPAGWTFIPSNIFPCGTGDTETIAINPGPDAALYALNLVTPFDWRVDALSGSFTLHGFRLGTVSGTVDGTSAGLVNQTGVTPSGSVGGLVLKTGQTTCYDISGTLISCAGTGQDGEYQKGFVDALTRFTDNTDGTITDNKTGLVWVKQILCAFPLNWQQALDHANNLADGQCGLSDGSVPGDWRLPNYRELQSLNWQYNVGVNDSGLPISDAFTIVNNGFIWSSTSDFPTPQNAFCLVTNGASSPALKTRTDIAGGWAVRDVPPSPPPGC